MKEGRDPADAPWVLRRDTHCTTRGTLRHWHTHASSALEAGLCVPRRLCNLAGSSASCLRPAVSHVSEHGRSPRLRLAAATLFLLCHALRCACAAAHQLYR